MFIAGIKLLSSVEICMMTHFHSFATIFFFTRKRRKTKEKKETTTGSALIETARSQQNFTTFSKNNEYK